MLIAALELLREALAELNDTRHREGQRIRELLLSRCASMRTQVQAVQGAPAGSLAAPARAHRRAHLAARRRRPIPSGSSRSWCCTRTRWTSTRSSIGSRGHLDEVTAVLDSSEPAGRRLDFLMQELNREANTLSSKSQDSETTRAAVDMKVAIEQMREQVQNVE